MAGEILIFDATGSNVDGTDPGTAVEVGPQDDLRLREFDAPAPPQTVQYAGSVDTEGGVPSSRKHENRVITLKILCMTAASLRSLQGKVGKLAREGGTLKWILPGAETVIFDVLAADTFAPAIDKLLYVRSGAFCEVQIVLPAKPYGRGASVTLSGHTATSKAPLVFTETGIKGDMWGLGTLTVDNVTASKTLLVWGLRSRRYDASAPLFYEAESLTLSSGSLNAGFSGASGGGANKVVRRVDVGTSGLTLFNLPETGTLAPHVGTYRVFARMQASVTNTGIVSARVQWKKSIGDQAVVNPWVPVQTDGAAAIKGSWALVDLGMVTIPPARYGTQGWTAYFDAKSTIATDDLDWDWVAFVPVDEGYGRLTMTGTTVITAGSAAKVAYDAAKAQVSAGSYWFNPNYAGDFLFIPPAGAEARTVEIFALLTGPTAGSGNLTDTVADADNIDAITGTLTYTPRYLVVPEP